MAWVQALDLTGPPGADGADGTDGADGAPGADGADGADGTDGIVAVLDTEEPVPGGTPVGLIVRLAEA